MEFQLETDPIQQRMKWDVRQLVLVLSPVIQICEMNVHPWCIGYRIDMNWKVWYITMDQGCTHSLYMDTRTHDKSPLSISY